MKKIVATVFVLTLLASALSLAGCKGESSELEESETLAVSLLLKSTQAMSDLSGYRMSGSIVMDAEGAEAARAGLPMTIDFQAEVQQAGGELSQHMAQTTTSGSITEYKTESYLIGNQFYQYIPNQGWVYMNFGAYKIQNLNMGLIDAQLLELMAELAQDARVFEEDGEKVGVYFHLDERLMKAALDIGKRYLEESGQSLPEEWLHVAEEAIAGSQADVRMWVWRESNLVERMETEYVMGGAPPLENMRQTIQIRLYDYNQDMVIVLPEEAKGAKEFTIPTT